MQLSDLLHIARAAALEAGAAILEVYASGEFGTTLKTDTSPLTLADKAAHEVILRHLQPAGLPILSEEGMQIPYSQRKNWDWYWLVDPLDGTKEFLKRNGEFTVNIALMQHDIPVGGVIYAPTLDTLYYGAKEFGAFTEERESKIKLTPSPEKTTLASLLQQPEVTAIASRSHFNAETEAFLKQFRKTSFMSMGSSLKFMLLAENKAEVYPRFAPTMEWDTAAAHAILIALNRGIFKVDLQSQLVYNKPDLLNPSFVAL